MRWAKVAKSIFNQKLTVENALPKKNWVYIENENAVRELAMNAGMK